MGGDFEKCAGCDRRLEFDLLEKGLCCDCRTPIPAQEASQVIEPIKPLPAHDPLIQEFREKHGRAKQEALYPECDPLPGERGF